MSSRGGDTKTHECDEKHRNKGRIFQGIKVEKTYDKKNRDNRSGCSDWWRHRRGPSSLDLADMGYKIYVLEKSPTIGGVMAQLDKTFPTNDCSMCILSPKLVDCARHQNIEILTNTTVQTLEGTPGNFTIKAVKKPRYIDIEKCTSCGSCEKSVPFPYRILLNMDW